ncbi:hypothetical protein Angca_001622 [Angiostrongylus cantonensis]|nr:hypothetical protein Angca_001622 [Angiostrongylus cantonensis]
MNDCSNGRLVSFFIQGDDVISCEVCLEPFQIPSKPPKILPCGHNFCDQCLFSLCCHQQYYLLDSIKCPTCHRTFPTNVAIEAPTNWELCKILENVRQGREMNVTVIHVPDKPTTMLPSSTSAGPSEKRRPETTERKSQCIVDQNNTNKKMESEMRKSKVEEKICPRNLFQVLGELRELRRKVIQTFRLPATTSGDVRENSVGEGKLSEALTSLDNAIQLVESTTIICPKKLIELRNEQIHKCSRSFSRRLIAQERSSDISLELAASPFLHSRSTSRSSCPLNNGSLDLVPTFLPENHLGSELYTLIKAMPTTDTVQQRCEAYVKAARIITDILYDDIPLEQLSVFADALLQCFHQANILSKKSGPISKTVSRKTIWKYVQMSYTELLRLGAKNYLSHEPERLALLDDLAYLCYIFSDVCDQATVTICMIEAARARVASGTLSDQDQQKTAQRLKVIDEHLLECRRVQKLQDLRTTKTKKTVKLKQLWKFFFRCSKSRA